MKTDINAIGKELEKRISGKRMKHMYGVAYEAMRLADKWGESAESAYIAGMVHDCAKELGNDETFKLLREFGFEITEEFRACPPLLHAPLGAYIAERDFGIDDRDILNAVRYHTTGRPNMSLLEKIIYVSDFIEPSRSFRDVELVRGIAYEELDAAVLCEAEMIIVFNFVKGKYIHTDSLRTRNAYLRPDDNYSEIRNRILQRIE